MSKNNPKTIADLKIDWTFDYSTLNRYFNDTRSEFRKLNTEIHDLLIAKRKYKFFVSYSNETFEINVMNWHSRELTDLILELDYQIYSLQVGEKLSKLLILDRFELIKKNEFRIHVKS